MNYRIAYANAADADLREIATYHRNTAGDVIAEELIEDILVAAESLTVRPARLRERSELARGLRALGIKNYLIFYRIEADTVRIVRVMHSARDIKPRHFPREKD